MSVNLDALKPPRTTTLIELEWLNNDLVIASEGHQRTGSFKYRAAYNLVAKTGRDHYLAASSGNFGAALAYCCQQVGARCTLVMPQNSIETKVTHCRGFGAEIEFVDTHVMTRKEKVGELASQYPEAYLASAYDDDYVIEGNASLGYELSKIRPLFDAVIIPIGGGGLSAGIITGLRKVFGDDQMPQIWGAEPRCANDASISLEQGEIWTCPFESYTIADGARTLSLGQRNWNILQPNIEGIVEVSDPLIKEGVRALYELANIKAEPTGALSFAALFDRKKFEHKRICCIMSGGNVDPHMYAQLITYKH